MGNRMSQQTQLKIIDSFFCLLKQKSYEEITVVDIAKQAGCSRKTFYRCFGSKNQLLNEYLEQLMYEWIKCINCQRPTSNIELIDLLFTFLKNYSHEFKIMINANLNTKILEKFNETFPKYFIEFHKHTNKPLSKAYLKYISYLRLGGIWNMYSNWLTYPGEIPFNSLQNLVKSEYNK